MWDKDICELTLVGEIYTVVQQTRKSTPRPHRLYRNPGLK